MNRSDALENLKSAADAARRMDSPASLRWAAVLDIAIADMNYQLIQEERSKAQKSSDYGC
jgi:hypothetical protein